MTGLVSYAGYDVVDVDGNKIGMLESVYVDTTSDLAAFATVTVGVPSRRRLAFVPLAGARVGPKKSDLRASLRDRERRLGRGLGVVRGELAVDKNGAASLRLLGSRSQVVFQAPERRRLTPAGHTEINDEPDYSPTAAEIAWTRRTSASYDVWTMTVDPQGRIPTALTNLTNGLGNSRYPSWSPDGTRLAFASDRPTETTRRPKQKRARVRAARGGPRVANVDGGGRGRRRLRQPNASACRLCNHNSTHAFRGGALRCRDGGRYDIR